MSTGTTRVSPDIPYAIDAEYIPDDDVWVFFPMDCEQEETDRAWIRAQNTLEIEGMR